MGFNVIFEENLQLVDFKIVDLCESKKKALYYKYSDTIKSLLNDALIKGKRILPWFPEMSLEFEF